MPKALVVGGTIVAGALATTNVYPIVAFIGCMTVVTIIALFRARRDDVPKIFESWSRAFGFARTPASYPPSDGTIDPPPPGARPKTPEDAS